VEEESVKMFAVVAFKVPEPHSILYRNFITKEKLLEAVSEAIDKGANVISVREVRKVG
jgi:hypothetical protein